MASEQATRPGRNRQATASLRAEQAAARQFSAAQKVQATYQAAYQAQERMAARLDADTVQLGLAQQKVTDLRSARSQMASGIASSAAGFASGILGHPDTRTNAARVLQGLQYDRSKVVGFQRQIAHRRLVRATSGRGY